MATNSNMFAPDSQQQQLQLQRQQQMADMLRKEAVTPIESQTVTGAGPARVVPTSPWLAMAKALQGGMAGYQQAGIDDKTAALGNAVNERKAQDMSGILAALSGKPAVHDAPEELGQQGPAYNAPAVPGDRRAALALALRSSDPAAQAIGNKLLETELAGSKFGNTPHYDQNGKAFVLNDKGEMKTLDGVQARDKMENVNGVWQNPYAQGANSFAPQDPNKPFGIGPKGVVPNQAYQDYAKSTAKAGAANISNKTEVKMGESIAGQIGPILKDSAIGAQGAVQQVDSAQRIIKAIDTNKVYAGPMASTRLKIAQVGDVLGVNGKDSEEKIANTRNVIRGLSELTLQGRKSMRGEGAITESEGKLAEQAMSGNIDMTASEIKQLAKASERVARFNHAEHQRKLNLARNNPSTSNMAGYYDTQPMPAETQSKSSNIQSLLDKYK